LGFFGTKLLSIFALFPVALVHCGFLCFAAILRFPVIGQALTALIPPGSGFPDSLCYIGSNSTYCKVVGKIKGNDDDVVSGKAYTAYSYLSFQGDAGNSVTAQCVSEAALTLVFNRDSLPERSDDGFGTPAEILGEALLKRCRETKVRPVLVKTSMNSPIL
jgi:hypothetical protein